MVGTFSDQREIWHLHARTGLAWSLQRNNDHLHVRRFHSHSASPARCNSGDFIPSTNFSLSASSAFRKWPLSVRPSEATSNLVGQLDFPFDTIIHVRKREPNTQWSDGMYRIWGLRMYFKNRRGNSRLAICIEKGAEKEEDETENGRMLWILCRTTKIIALYEAKAKKICTVL